MICAVLSNEPIAPGVFDLRLDMGAAGAEQKPGRFLHIAVGLTLRRPLGLCEPGRVVYAVRGEGTRRLARAKKGDLADILGPLGRGFPESDEPTLLLGGGMGAPPLLYCSRSLKSSAALLSFRGQRSVILASDFANCDVHIGERFPAERIGSFGLRRVFACGPRPMLAAVAKECARLGLPCFVLMEERMACGVGACLVCACAVTGGGYSRVCADGPVFPAEQVAWHG
ncbi:MAG: dihydroorotate dehydrogenase electron transfer subunit [Oscillospiraceae bacterium]|jgi:dihydroorotate dehydrogenase electron transfer subunit|nr:dihydroorotate dehydrogenase electron transfer subunit [Oscillospiraceae bacterium]